MSLSDIATRHQVLIERLKVDHIKTLSVYLKSMIKAAEYELMSNDELTDLNRKDLAKRITIFKKILKEGFTAFKLEFDNIIKEFVEYEINFEINSLNSIYKYDYSAPSANQVLTSVYNNPFNISGVDNQSLIEPFYKNYTDNQVYRVGNIIQAGYANGLTNERIRQNLKDTGYQVMYRDAEALIRTTVQHAANQARNKVWENNADIITGIEWVSTLDSRTSTICQALDKRVWDINDPNKQLPPAHIRCRSTTAPVFDPEFDILDKGKTRMSRNPETGKGERVSDKKSYYSWLKDQPAEFQDEILGKKKGKLLRNGGLTIKRFTELQLDKKFRPLTLDEMKQLEPLAFEKANI